MKKETERPLLATKFFIPPLRKSLVVRPRLIKQLDDSFDQRLILVTAPAGFGKTTFVTAWLAQQQRKAAWVSLDKNDNDPVLFLSYIVAAMQQIESGLCGTILPLLQSSDPPAPQILLTYLINDLAFLREPAVLVLDDYHLIESDQIHDLVSFLVDHTPNTLQIVITSRITPAFSVARLRALNQLVEISAFDLRFNIAETRQFLNELMQLQLAESDVEILARKTEGWVTGLQLAALSMKEQIGSDFIRKLSGDDRFISDYLIDEVLSQQTVAVREFLMKTAVLKRLSAPLCNHFLKIDNAESILLHLEKNYLFLIPLDNRREWFRYHHLFGELLLSRLQAESPEQIPVLNQKAAVWYEQNDQIEEAIEYALAASDFEYAISLIKNVGAQIHDSQRRTSFIRWTNKLPFELVQKNTFLWVQYIIAEFYYSNFKDVLHFLEKLGVIPIELPNSADLPVEHALAYPLLAALTLHTTLDANRVLELNGKALPVLPEDEKLIRGIALGHSGSASLALGDIDSAHTYLTEGLELIISADPWSVALVFNGYLGETIAARGELRLAAVKFREYFNGAHNRNLHEGHSFTNVLVGSGMLHYEWNELEEAAKLIIEGIRVAKSTSVDRLSFALMALIKLKTCANYPIDIEHRFKTIEAIASEFGSPQIVLARVEALRARLNLFEGKQQDALLWADAFAKTHPKITAFLQIEWMVVARIWMRSGKERDCIQLLQKLSSLAREDGRERDQIKLSAMLITAFVAVGEIDLALSLVQKLLVKAEPEGYIRTFVDEGENMQRVLQMVWDGNGRFSQNISPTYLQKILNAFPNPLPIAKEVIFDNLTPRETEILHLLSQGHSYSQMANLLTITDNTLKTHIKRIYSKLNVNNRVQAILAAKKAGILLN